MPRRKQFKYNQVNQFSNVFDSKNLELNDTNLNLEKLEKYPLFFQSQHPLVLELGCGYGEYTNSLARFFPQKNFIGVDIKGDRLWKGAKFATENKLANVAFLRSDIKKIITYFGPQSVDEIWVTFPDPQPNKPRKRLFYKDFLQIYEVLLKPGGLLFLKTDNRDFFGFSLSELTGNANFKVLAKTSDLYKSEILAEAFDIQTRYEKKFTALGFDICFLKAERAANL